MRVYIVIFFAMLFMCNTSEISNKLSNLDLSSSRKNELTKEEVIRGLKEALKIGTQKAVNIVSKKDGFWNNPLIRIPIPEKLKNVTDKLSRLGFKKDVQKFHKQLNIAAEKSSKKALNIFVEQITKITFEDAIVILTGNDSSITTYFKEKTYEKLYTEFKPDVNNTLNDLKIIAFYEKLIDIYNKIPLVKKVNFDLTNYVTEKTLEGLFLELKNQEKNIRNKEVFRETKLLKRVFDKNNWHWNR